MVIDRIANAHLYRPLGPQITRALDFIRDTELASLEPGRHAIDGDDVYALVSEYPSKRPEEGRWEAHRRYLDLQSVVSGTERIGYAPAEGLAAGPYDEAQDIIWLEGSGDLLTLVPGRFMLLWPGDAHMPGIAVGLPAPVRKVVLKIRLAGK
jgi:YhcH/YjgK/YiaL family protein